MHYYLYKLNFPYGVHFGADKAGIGLEKISPNCHCDTFFSALCHEIIKLHGEEALNEFYKETVAGNFLFTDLLPYNQDDLMIPKPILFIEKSEEDNAGDSIKKKKMKNLQFIPLSKLSDFFAGNIDEVNFEKSMLYEKSSPSRNGIAEDNGLFSVAITKFLDNCGLYFIVKMPEDKEEWFENIIRSLGLSGLGGKRTSGYGQFKISDSVILDETSPIAYESLMAKYLNKEGQYNLLLSAFYPQKNEIEKIKNGYYTLIQRQGFVQSTTYSDTILKKLPTAMINAGSCFEEKFKGDIIDVSNDGKHPVYRYGKPIMIGIDL